MMKVAWYFLLVFVSVVTIGCDTESGPDEAASPEMQPTAVEKQELPYEIASRPMPTGEQVDTLLPLQVGPFRRQSVRTPQDIHKGSFYATYTRNMSTVNVELGICATASDSQMAIGRAKAETDAEFPDAHQLFVKWQEITCLRTVTRLGAFMAWTRGPYYFSVHAKGGEKDLDEMMEAFPY